MWELRAGRETGEIPPVMGAFLYFSSINGSDEDYSAEELLNGIAGGDRSMIVPLTALLVSEGKTDISEIYWEMNGQDLPATRNDVLNALSWFGRFTLYPVMALNPAIPADMEGTMHSDQCAAVCALGWMITRKDGLFHGEELLSSEDIKILSSFFPAVSPDLRFIPRSYIDHCFQSEAETPR